MPCGNIGDDEDDVGDREPSWWFDIEPRETPDDPDSFMYIFSNELGDAIDRVSNWIVGALVVFSAAPVMLFTLVTGRNPFGGHN